MMIKQHLAYQLGALGSRSRSIQTEREWQLAKVEQRLAKKRADLRADLTAKERHADRDQGTGGGKLNLFVVAPRSESSSFYFRSLVHHTRNQSMAKAELLAEHQGRRTYPQTKHTWAQA